MQLSSDLPARRGPACVCDHTWNTRGVRGQSGHKGRLNSSEVKVRAYEDDCYFWCHDAIQRVGVKSIVRFVGWVWVRWKWKWKWKWLSGRLTRGGVFGQVIY